MKILVIAAHPDDEVLGMGGTIKKHTKAGDEVRVLIMATGIHARRSHNLKNISTYNVSKKITKKMDEQVKELEEDARKTAKLLGVKKISFVRFPDNEMDKVSNLEITKIIEKNIREYLPKVVYTHSHYDINIDHRACYFATLTATRPVQNQSVKEVISFEVPSSTEWYFPLQFSPNIFIDISGEISTKIKALKFYKNEIKDFPHPRSEEAIKVISQRWGSVSGCKNAEAFYLVRKTLGSL